MENNTTPSPELVELLCEEAAKDTYNEDYIAGNIEKFRDILINQHPIRHMMLINADCILNAMIRLDTQWQGRHKLQEGNANYFKKLYEDEVAKLTASEAECARLKQNNNEMQKYLRHDMGCASTVNPRIINDGRCNCSIAKYLGKTEPINCYHQWINDEFGKPKICSRCGIKPINGTNPTQSK